MKNIKIESFIQRLNQEIDQLDYGQDPPELYEPIRYIMNLGGKRMRPLLSLLSYLLFKDDWETIVKPAVTLELFHNFTLMHDDIMDQASMRRGEATVHEKWNSNVAILAGDVMLVKTYDYLLDIPGPKLVPVFKKFNKCAAEVCEGQQKDMNFEQEPSITEAQYLDMIRLKTAVLLGFSLEMGALLADADLEQQQLLYDFGVKIGTGFQLKDDWLDVFADQEKFGKQVGGDIVANKKTYLLIKALEKAEGRQKDELYAWLNANQFDRNEKVAAVTTIYENLGIKAVCHQKIKDYFAAGFNSFNRLNIDPERKKPLEQFVMALVNREK